MIKTSDKLILGVLVILMIGLSSVFITAVTAEGSSSNTVSASETNTLITIEQAKMIALEAVPGVITESEIEKENGIIIYEIEIIKDNKEYEVNIDPKTGLIIKIELDDEDEKISPQELKKIGGLITEEEAIKIALEHIGEGTVVGFETEKEHGRIIYEVEIRAKGDRVEVEVDAQTGKIIEVEWGDDD